MIPYSRDPHQVIPVSSVKIIGLGGAGTNMLERIALDGVEGAGLIALNTDIRTLGSCLAGDKIQLGTNLTKGLGTGGDPELGHQAVLEAEEAIRESIKDSRIVFLCVGLGGGTGSGAAPIVTRIAREEGAFVVVFATMPFAFEGKRRRDQAETALNELAVLSNALVTFDNNRMGELVLAKQGIHDAFTAADHMICESIKAVLRLVVRPGLINVGLDDLMSALRTTRSRCLFGSGMAEGKDRAAKALRGALASPLLDQGALLKDAQTVLVHLCGGEDLTLFEIELMMQSLGKFVPENAHVLFGAAIDPTMNNKLSLTLISAMPEDSLALAPRESLSRGDDNDNPLLDPSQGFTKTAVKPAAKPAPPVARALPKAQPVAVAATPALFDDEQPFAEPALPAASKPEATAPLFADLTEIKTSEKPAEEKHSAVMVAEFIAVPTDDEEDLEQYLEAKPVANEEEDDLEEPERLAEVDEMDDFELADLDLEAAGFSTLPPQRPDGVKPWTTAMGPKESEPTPKATPEPEPPKLKLGIKATGPQSELSLDSTPRGRFEGENPNVLDGEDLDLPPFLRKKK
jgi:cell division protein FtsZ